jgi:hypothetical protein
MKREGRRTPQVTRTLRERRCNSLKVRDRFPGIAVGKISCHWKNFSELARLAKKAMPSSGSVPGSGAEASLTSLSTVPGSLMPAAVDAAWVQKLLGQKSVTQACVPQAQRSAPAIRGTKGSGSRFWETQMSISVKGEPMGPVRNSIRFESGLPGPGAGLKRPASPPSGAPKVPSGPKETTEDVSGTIDREYSVNPFCSLNSNEKLIVSTHGPEQTLLPTMVRLPLTA